MKRLSKFALDPFKRSGQLVRESFALPFPQAIFLIIKLVLLLVLFTLDFSQFFGEVYTRSEVNQQGWKMPFVVGFAAVSYLSILIITFLRSWPLRILLTLPCVSLIYMNQMAFWTVGDRLHVAYITELFGSKELLNAFPLFVAEYQSVVIFSTIIYIVSVTILCITPRSLSSLYPWPYALAPISLSLLVAVMGLMVFSTRVVIWTPSPIGLPYGIAQAMSDSAFYSNLEREKVEYSGTIDKGIGKIIFIVDESVYGNALTINGGPKNVTNYLASGLAEMSNFGIAVSAYNSSAIANLILRTGLREDQLPDEKRALFTVPTIWSFAQNSGYETIYLNAQNVFTNYMTFKEIANIDKVYHTRAVEWPMRDFMICGQLRSIIKDDSHSSLVYVNKYGAHWPYAGAYPPGRDIFYPIVDDYSWLNKAEKPRLDHLLENAISASPMNIGPAFKDQITRLASSQDKSRLRLSDSGNKRTNAYYNAINWTVDEFFQCLLEDLELNNTVIVYTSDHGQYVYADDNPTGNWIGHGSRKNPEVEQGLIPLMIFTEQEKLHGMFDEAAKLSHNKMTHFQIFPTILTLMGYDKAWVNEHYGAGLLDKAPDTQSFYYSNVFDRRDIGAFKVDQSSLPNSAE